MLAVETDQLPGDAVAAHVAERAGVAESSVFLPAFAAASLTGSVVAASRASELATMRLTELGYDPQNVLSVTGSAPVPPVADDEAVAMAWANDAVAYGGQVHLVLDEPPTAPAALASTAAAEYGLPFVEIFESVDWAYAELDRALFAPAQVTVDVVGGESYVAGEPDDAALAAAWH
ncbi:MAG: methenyltetrahydromethanopterin cyclohydrolase [halophilic archaeon J07HX5]|nr:MAG: methenyltetrahydromethanopterin cyclohydrolase [halophilic archaeon J07HX5]